MKKYLTRALAYQNDKIKHMPEILHRWKMYTALRKTLKYQFRFCNNSYNKEKGQMQRAFNRWRKGPGMLTEELWKLPIDTVVKLGLKTTEELKDVQEQLAENQNGEGQKVRGRSAHDK